MLTSTLLVIGGFISLSMAGYVLEDEYDPDTFFSQFDFFTGADPTHGYVNYVDQSTAESQGLIGQRDGSIYIGTDHTNVASGRGRNSVRLISKKTSTRGLIILDLQHMPGGQCGSWPAFWTLGPQWPSTGEIDIIEGVNSQTANDMTLHTGAGCNISNTGSFTGHMTTLDCDVNAPGQYPNAGCQIASHDTATYGSGFNANGGGVYATEWTSKAISIWFFPRGAMPDDLSSGDPDPSGWGKPAARFEGECEIDQHFQNHNLIFDLTFCGDWAANVWGQDPVCSAHAPTCQEYVQKYPTAFSDAYWQVNSLKVYQSGGQAANKMLDDESADSRVMVSSQAVGSPAPLPIETGGTSVLQEEDLVPPPCTPTSAPTSSPSPVATAMQKPTYKTVSALRWDYFGSSSPGQPAGGKEKRSIHARHLLKHQRQGSRIKPRW